MRDYICGLVQHSLKAPKWFTEGFVDYYADKINYLFDNNKDKFIENYNNKLLAYFKSQLHQLNDQELEDNFLNFV